MEITEGRARIDVNDGVFYNPEMVTLRNISVAFINSMGSAVDSLLDCTAATGIRGIRYELESGAKNVVMLDMNMNAYENALLNVGKNGTGAKVLNTSLQEFANSSHARFDVIDLDPFGSPTPYIFDLMKVSKDGTVLMATATDTAVLCGAHAKACLRVYGAMPLHNKLCHEAGIRILIGYIARIAAQFNFGIEVLLAISDLHYMRAFLRMRRGAVKAVESFEKIGFVSACPRCHNFTYSVGITPHIVEKCSFCGAEMHASGPLWLGALYDKKIVGGMLSSPALDSRGFEIIDRIYHELDIPFSYSIPKITKYLGIGAVPFGKVLERLGRDASRTHFDHEAIKTSAEIGEVVKVVKELAAKSQE